MFSRDTSFSVSRIVRDRWRHDFREHLGLLPFARSDSLAGRVLPASVVALAGLPESDFGG